MKKLLELNDTKGLTFERGLLGNVPQNKEKTT